MISCWVFFVAALTLSLGLGDVQLNGAEGRATVVVRPRVIDDVLTNPGIGFMTFQRFEGDKLDTNDDPSEGFPIDYQAIQRSKPPEDFPKTTMAYFRIYWRFIEPKEGEYHWELIDRALATARARHQTLLLRLPPYGPDRKSDLPAWYRAIANEPDYGRKFPNEFLRSDPENPAYVKYYGRLIRAFGLRYNGDPDIESVDVSIVGAWGEGGGSDLLKPATRNSLLDAYFDTFTKTTLLMQFDHGSFDHARERGVHVGWREDCLGDIWGFSPTWCHMYDKYPEEIIHLGLQDNWRTEPVSFEVCGTLKGWKKHNLDVDYIIDQSLKWHISSFNAKSSAVPRAWKGKIDRWLKKMGYRFALRKFVFPARAVPSGQFEYSSWWENLGVAPSYHNFPVAVRLKRATTEALLLTDSDIRTWMPGDNLLEGTLKLPDDLPEGDYDLSLAIIDPATHRPRIQLASEGRRPDGWYGLGKIRVEGLPGKLK